MDLAGCRVARGPKITINGLKAQTFSRSTELQRVDSGAAVADLRHLELDAKPGIGASYFLLSYSNLACGRMRAMNTDVGQHGRNGSAPRQGPPLL